MDSIIEELREDKEFRDLFLMEAVISIVNGGDCSERSAGLMMITDMICAEGAGADSLCSDIKGHIFRTATK